MANTTKKTAKGAQQYTKAISHPMKPGDMGINVNTLRIALDAEGMSDADFKSKYNVSKAKAKRMTRDANNDAGIEQLKERYKKGSKLGLNKGGYVSCGASNPASQKRSK